MDPRPSYTPLSQSEALILVLHHYRVFLSLSCVGVTGRCLLLSRWVTSWLFENCQPSIVKSQTFLPELKIKVGQLDPRPSYTPLSQSGALIPVLYHCRRFSSPSCNGVTGSYLFLQVGPKVALLNIVSPCKITNFFTGVKIKKGKLDPGPTEPIHLNPGL